MTKTTVIYVKFVIDVACQQFLKSANVLCSYAKNKMTLFMDHVVVSDLAAYMYLLFPLCCHTYPIWCLL